MPCTLIVPLGYVARDSTMISVARECRIGTRSHGSEKLYMHNESFRVARAYQDERTWGEIGDPLSASER